MLETVVMIAMTVPVYHMVHMAGQLIVMILMVMAWVIRVPKRKYVLMAPQI
jgi:hypothetical protein